MTLPTAIDDAVGAVREHFAGHPVEVIPDGAGGATVIVDSIDIGSQYTPSVTWLGFQISAAYSIADVYPHYVGAVDRVDGRPHGEAISRMTWQNREALQLSRRSHHWRPGIDNAVLKAEKVLVWLRTR